MAAIDRVESRLRAGGMSAAEASTAVAAIASAGYDLAERASSSPAVLGAGGDPWAASVRSIAGRARATIHTVKIGDEGWVVWAEISGVRLGAVFAPRPAGALGDDPFVIEV